MNAHANCQRNLRFPYLVIATQIQTKVTRYPDLPPSIATVRLLTSLTKTS